MATYYGRGDGTAATKEAATGPITDPAGCMNAATYNTESAGFSNGDTFVVADNGGPFTDATLVPAKVGVDGAEIEHVASGTPVISAADPVTGFERAYSYLSLPGQASDFARTLDNAALDITGDIDLQWRGALTDWTPAAAATLMAKFRVSTADRSWHWFLNTNGTMSFRWSVDGSAAITKTSSAATGISDGTVGWVRVTLDVDNGSSDAEVKFYTGGSGLTPSWVQLGTTQTNGSTTSIYSGIADLYVGYDVVQLYYLIGKVHRAIIKNGIAGTTVYDADFTLEAAGTTSFTEDGSGLTVTIGQSGDPKAEIVADTSIDIWKATLTNNPGIVYMDDDRGDRKDATTDLVNEFDWTHTGGELYVYSATDPDAAYTAVEAAVRTHAMALDVAYNSFTGITFRYARTSPATGGDSPVEVANSGDATGSSFTSCIFERGARAGFICRAAAGTTAVTVTTCTAQWNSGTGFVFYAPDCVVTNCIGQYNGTDAASTSGGGLYSEAPTLTINGGTYTQNGNDYGYHHGVYLGHAVGASATVTGVSCPDNTFGDGFLIKQTATLNRCIATGSFRTGFKCEEWLDEAITVTLNYCIATGNREGIAESAAGATDPLTLNVYNCVLYANNREDVPVTGVSPGEIRFVDDETYVFKNNIIRALDSRCLTSVALTGATFDYNCWYLTGAEFLIYYDGAERNWAYWTTTLSQDANGINADPLMVDPGSGDFTLQAGSPCRDAGVDVGLDTDYAGNPVPVGAAPDIGAYEWQGAGPEGAGPISDLSLGMRIGV
jgi:hypothetical protein